MHSPLTEMHLLQADDGQHLIEIETTALAHVACAPQDSGVLLTEFAAAYPSVNHSWIFSVLEHTGLPDFLCGFLRSIERDSITHVWEEHDEAVLRVAFCLQWSLARFFDGSKNLLSQGTSTI